MIGLGCCKCCCTWSSSGARQLGLGSSFSILSFLANLSVRPIDSYLVSKYCSWLHLDTRIAALRSVQEHHTEEAHRTNAVSMHGLPLYLMVLAAASAYASPASPSSDRMPMFNSTLQVAFAEDNSRGLFQVSIRYTAPWQMHVFNFGIVQDGVTLLRGANGNNDTSSQVPQGLLLQFNQSTGMAANGSSSVVPFFALVSCDQSESLVGATLNSTLSTEGNSTTGANSTMTTNSTSVDVFSLAATLNAVAVILYSELEQVRKFD